MESLEKQGKAEGEVNGKAIHRGPFASLLQRLLRVAPSELKDCKKTWREHREAERI